MGDKVVVITGGNAGIGKETAVELARRGFRVVITARDQARGATARDEIIRRSTFHEVDVMELDLASLGSVRRFASELLDRFDRLDVLIDNAGLVLQHRQLTADGFEETFGVNHLGHFALTDLLLARLHANPDGARVVVVASHAHKSARRGIDFDDLQTTTHRYRPFAAYARSKLANILFARELARRVDGSGITANSLHPGFVNSRFGRDGDLKGVVALGSRVASSFAISERQGAETSIYLASSPDVTGVSGEYFYKCRPARPSAQARDEESARRLWDVSAELVGVS